MMKKIKKKKQFVFLWGNGKEYQNYMCWDLRNFKNVYVINHFEAQNWKEKQEDLCAKYRNAIIGKWINKKICIQKLKLKRKRINYLIFSEDYFIKIDWNVLQDLQKQYSIKTVLYVNDAIERRMNFERDNLSVYKGLLDLIVTTDRKDAEKYNIAFFPLFYSNIPVKKTEKIKYDVSFVGRNKGRKDLIGRIKNEAEKKGLTVYFRLREGLNADTLREAWIPYKNILDTANQSNCILEVLQENQSGISLRTMEAVIFNKKLLTNNKDIVNYSFYDEKYIQIFSEVDNIDFNFMMERIPVSYKYKGEYSPIYFLREIIKLLK